MPDRVTGCAVLAGAPPLDDHATFKQLNRMDRGLAVLANRAPITVRVTATSTRLLSKYVPHALLRASLRGLPSTEAEAVRTQGRWLPTILGEGAANPHGVVDSSHRSGCRSEVQRLTSWPIKLSRENIVLSCSVKSWAGARDQDSCECDQVKSRGSGIHFFGRARRGQDNSGTHPGKGFELRERHHRKPDNTCDSCREISAGTSLDVLEIDAASNRGIDQIRELREMVRYAPASSRYKVVILDEAHQLTDEASNALLKTLEEPPDRVVFVLATTRAEDCRNDQVARAAFSIRSLTFQEIASKSNGS